MNLDDFSTEELIGVIEKRGFVVSLTPDDDAVVAECRIKKKYLGDSDWDWKIYTVTKRDIKEFVKSIKEKGDNEDNYCYHEFKKAVGTTYFETDTDAEFLKELGFNSLSDITPDTISYDTVDYFLNYYFYMLEDDNKNIHSTDDCHSVYDFIDDIADYRHEISCW